jgi:hypothetical protein
VPHPDGSVTTEKQTEIHDNVIVWIEAIEDGVTVVQGEDSVVVSDNSIQEKEPAGV